MEKVNSHGLMEESMTDNGKQENNMELENISTRMVKPEKELGKMERDKLGLRMK